MGNCATTAVLEFRAEREKSGRIDQDLRRERNERDRVVQICLCGRDEDNRFMKQLRTQYPLDWPLLSEVQREHRRQQVFSVVVTQLTDLLAIVESGEDGEVEGAQRLYHERDPSTAIEMNAELVECLVGVWENDNVQAVLEQYRSEDTFEDLEYFMNNTDRVLQHDSIVSVEDWSHVNLKSTGLVSQSLSLHGVRFEIHDSTRLGCEERKWRHMFDGVNSIMFLVPINEFDQSLFDDALVNSVQDDMDVFNCIVNNPYSRDANIFLIFTNISLFREKLQVLPIKICDNAHPERNRWTDYAGIEGMSETIAEVEEEAQQGIDYFRNKFLDLLEDRRHKEIFHFTLDVEDGEMFRRVTDAVTQRILMQAMNNWHFDPAWGP